MKKALVAFVLLCVPVTLYISSASAQPFVGSKNSNKYHKVTCNWAQKISPDNKIVFKDVEEAKAAGYVPCKVCRPPAAGVPAEQYVAPKKFEKQKSTTPTESRQCAAITKKGTRCKRRAEPGSAYCWQHSR